MKPLVRISAVCMLNLICADLLLLLTLTQDGAVGEFVNTSLPSRTNRDVVSLVFVMIGKVLAEVGVFFLWILHHFDIGCFHLAVAETSFCRGNNGGRCPRLPSDRCAWT